MRRRDWLVRVACGATGGALARSGAFGAELPGDVASGAAGEFEATLARLGAARASVDGRLALDVPEDVWTGAMVAVHVDASRLEAVRAVHLLRDAHVSAEIVAFERHGTQPAVLTVPVRLERPCRLRVVVRTAGGWHRQDALVRTLGAPGCD